MKILVDVFLRIKETGDLKFPIGYDNIKAVLFVRLLSTYYATSFRKTYNN